MSALFILIGISLLLAIGFLFAFIVAANSGQFEDEYTPAIRVILDDVMRKEEEDKNI
jgi:cbb3-type cytochrome oxidase maturation protein